MVAELAGDMDSHCRLLRVDVAGDSFDGSPARLRAREFARNKGARHFYFQPRDLSGRWVCACGAAVAPTAAACGSDGRRTFGGNAAAARRNVFCKALVAAPELFPRRILI